MYYRIEWKEPAGKSIFTGEQLTGLVEAGTYFDSKLQAVRYYIEIIKNGDPNISSLRIFKGNRDITQSVNKFLYS